MVKVRPAILEDSEAILEIYSPYILATAFTFETDVADINDFRLRIEKCLQKFPWIVCEIDGLITGYVYASAHREREAYQWTCECSVYLHKDFKGKGIGKVLYKTLFHILKKQGLVNVYAGITLPNEASVKLHEKCGFIPFAVYENVGYKLGAWQKVGWWKLQLNELLLKPPPPIKFSELKPQIFADIFLQSAEEIELHLS